MPVTEGFSHQPFIEALLWIPPEEKKMHEQIYNTIKENSVIGYLKYIHFGMLVLVLNVYSFVFFTF